MRTMRAAGEVATGQAVDKLPVYAALQGDDGFPHVGVLDYAASELSTSTGTLQLRGRFDNAQRSIVPGIYATVMIYYGSKRDSVLVPSAVVSRDQQGSYVFVLGKDDKVERQNIATAQRYGSLTEVTQGLKADDQVIINGFVSLSVGQTVRSEKGTIESTASPGSPDKGSASN